MTEAEKLFHDIASKIPDGKEGKMFGALCVKAPNGKAAVMFWREHMIFRLKDKDQEDALKLSGAKVFEPMGNGRTMNGWIQVSYEHAGRWEEFAAKSMEVAKSIKKR